MLSRRSIFVLLIFLALVISATIPFKGLHWGMATQLPDLIVGRNVNMVGGQNEITGDPYLQRQNEPSLAVSARNPMHVLAASNDYRLVDFPESEGPLPGIPEGAAAGDAWMGIFKSTNGAQSFKGSLLPGHPFDTTTEGMNSPIHGLGAASDPTVRSGMGLFFISGIAFDRVEHGRSVIFVARYVDNNALAVGDTDPIKYIDTKLLDEGTSGQFADKPWIAIDLPRYGSETIPVNTPGISVQSSAAVQNIPRFNVYVVYSIFLGSEQGHPHSKIMFVRSTDCGNSWEKPVKLSESVHVCQGTNICVSPKDGTIYIAWRQYSRGEKKVPDAIVMCKSDDFGNTFTKASVVAEIDPFDQYTDAESFRTSTFPALAVDNNDIVYVAFSQQGEGIPNGGARIVITASKDGGKKWTNPEPINEHERGGHQIMPSLIFNGKLIMTWLDSQKSLGDTSGEGITGISQTIDTWAAYAEPSSPSGALKNPYFSYPATQVSRYLYYLDFDANGDPIIEQAEYNYPNFPLFVGGTAPFMGDYIDVTPAPMFLYDYVNGKWRFNTGSNVFDPSHAFTAFPCNRDVLPPREGFTWLDYWPPGSGKCDEWTAGLRNQNVYSAPITQGILVGSPVNTKPLQDYRRTFLVFVKNLTDYDKAIRLTIDAGDIDASFWEFDSPQECPENFYLCQDQVVEATLFAHSSLTLTVFVQPYAVDPLASFRVNVEEISFPTGESTGLNVESTGIKSSVIFNPDPVNTQMIPSLPEPETHTPTIVFQAPEFVEFADPSILTQLSYSTELLDFANPDVAAPGIRHPGIRHESIVNPGIRHTSITDNIPEGKVTDLKWSITNNGNTTSAYSFDPIGAEPSDPSVEYQVLYYRVSSTPISAENCQLSQEEHHELILSIESPGIRHPGIRHPGIRHPGIRHNTFFLAPGETAICALRLIDSDPPEEGYTSVQAMGILNNGEEFTPAEYATTVAGTAIPQAANPDGIIDFVSSLYIIAQNLPEGMLEEPYPEVQLEAYGGTPASVDDNGTPDDPDDDIWNYTSWVLALKSGESFPPGLALSSNGIISGTPTYDPDVSYPYDYYFTVEVKDESSPQQIARRRFLITVDCEAIITPSATEGGTIDPPDMQTVSCGSEVTFTMAPTDACYYLADVEVDGDSVGAVSEYTFIDVIGTHTIHAIYVRTNFAIASSATEGGSIEPLGVVNVSCGSDQSFDIIPNDGNQLMYLLIDGELPDPDSTDYELIQDPGNPNNYTCTFVNIVEDHEIHAGFGWVRRYNNDDVNEDDEARDIAFNKSSGDIFVTGFSTGRTTGPDYFTISYDGQGIERFSARYDGPSHEGDKANAIAADNAGNAYPAGSRFRGQPHKHSDYTTVKYNSSGTEMWDAHYDAERNGHDVITDIVADDGGNFVYVTGRSEDSRRKKDKNKHFDYYTIKYDAGTGDEEWAVRYNNADVNGQDEATAIAVDATGNIYVTGLSFNGSNNDIVTIKYDPNGNPVWSEEEPGTGSLRRYDAGANDEATDIAVDTAGYVYVTGRSEGIGSGFDYVTIKYDINGDQLWAVSYNNMNNDDEAAAIAVDAAGNVYVTGRSEGNNTDYDYATIKYSGGGSEDWVKRFDNVMGVDEAADIDIDSSGVYVTGRSQGNGTGFDYFTIKYDNSGNRVWQAKYNHADGADEAIAIIVDSEGNVSVTGRSLGSETGFDYATVKYEQ